MATPVRKRDLERLLARVPPPPAPRPDLEQYATPAGVAAEALFLAYAHGDVADRAVVDLGCGTGVLALGCAALGAARIVGVDTDERLVALGRATAADLGLAVEFAVGDASAFAGSFDTVVMNPPFGAQFASRSRGGDKPFLEAAWRLAPVTYSFHMAETAEHLGRFARENRVEAEPLGVFAFNLPATMHFHRKPRSSVDVALIRYERTA